MLDVLGLATYLHRDHHVVVSDPVFSGTTLQGTEVNGLMAEVLPFLAILRPKDTFYDTVERNLETALADREDLRRGGEGMVFVLAEDFEDVNGMARQVGLTARVLDADFIALSGDLTFAGKPVESYIIDTVDYYSDHKPVYFAPGLHDTSAIVDAARPGAGPSPTDDPDHRRDDAARCRGPPDLAVGDFGAGDVLRDPTSIRSRSSGTPPRRRARPGPTSCSSTTTCSVSRSRPPVAPG